MLMAVKGIMRGNTVVIENEDMKEYDGTEVVVTFLEYPKKKRKESIDWDSFVEPSERGKNVEEYMKEMRGETMESAVANVQDAKREWIIAALENGIEIQEPESFKLDLTKFMGRGEKLFQTDAQEYIRVMRDNDRI